MKKYAAVALCLSLLALPGCYKSEYEKAKQEAESAAKELADTKAKLSTAEARASAAEQQANRAKAGGMTLVTINSTKQLGRDTIKLVDTPQGQVFVKDGPRTRDTSTIMYRNGLLADQQFTINREGGTTPYVSGPVRNSRADGEWFWFDRAGKKTHRETFKEGKLVSVETVSVDRAGKESYKKLTPAEANKFFDARVVVFVNFPELTRER